MMPNQKPETVLRHIPDELGETLKVDLSITYLDAIASFILKDSVLRTRKVITNIRNLFDKIDFTKYDDKPDFSVRIWFIKKAVKYFLEGFDTENYIKQMCVDDLECDEEKKKFIDDFTPNITYNMGRNVIDKVNDMLEFGYTIRVKDTMLDMLNRIDVGDYKSYKQVQDMLYEISTRIVKIKRELTTSKGSHEFSLEDGVYDRVVEESVRTLKDKNRVYQVGIKRWNTILGGGYFGGRLYIYLALPGGGKSTILLKSVLDIKRYNRGIEPKDATKTPAVLMLTLENGIAETVERMYNMSVDGEDIRNFTPKQVSKKLKEQGDLRLSNTNKINILIREYKNRELETDDLYTIINDYADEGFEIIALVIDYLKRIRPSERAKDEKGELKNTTNELKEIAKYYDIPVISAQQMNRSAATVIDSAVQAKKEDLARLVGRDSVAGAWEILENADWTTLIQQETQRETGKLYLTFKMMKRRYRSTESDESLRRFDYFNHPFTEGNEIQLIDDFDLPQSLSVISLSTDFVSGSVSDDIPKKKKLTKNPNDNFDPFDPDMSYGKF